MPKLLAITIAFLLAHQTTARASEWDRVPATAPGVLQAAIGREAAWIGARDGHENRLLPHSTVRDMPSLDQRRSAQQRSWIGRHPVAFGALVGAGVGAAGCVLAAHHARETSLGPPLCGVAWPLFGAGGGALVGLIVARTR